MNPAVHTEKHGKNKILIVEDEEDIARLISYNLEQEGFATTVSYNGLDAWNKTTRSLPDLIILDLMLPGLNGFDFCKKVKEQYKIPIIVVTAKAGETDAVLALEIGADDYVRKPFSPRELMARVRVQLRKYHPETEVQEGNISCGKIHMNTAAHKVSIDDEAVELTLIEYNILKLFLDNPDIALTRDRILDRIWGHDVYISDRAVDVNVKRLREKLLGEKERLETVRGIGYRFRGDRSD